MTRPASLRTAWTVPRSRKIDQSAATWFQPASPTRASASASSPRVSAASSRFESEGPIARVEMRILAQARQPARDPIRLPVDEAPQRHRWVAEQPHRLRCVNEPAVGLLDTGEDRRFPEASAEGFGEPAHADRFRIAYVEGARRRGAMTERAQHHGIGVAL